jgi:hypothetical protein
MGKIILTSEKLLKLQEIIEMNLEALSQAQYSKPEVRIQISTIIMKQFKKYLGIV